MNVNYKSSNDETALHYAIFYNYSDVVNLLINGTGILT